VRFWDGSWITRGVEDFCFCFSLENPFASDLAFWDGLGYGGDAGVVVVEIGIIGISCFILDIVLIDVVIAGKS